jgi:stage II sporulation protein D
MQPRTQWERDVPVSKISWSSAALRVDSIEERLEELRIEPLARDLYVDPGGGFSRPIRGQLRIRAGDGQLKIVASMNLEDYVAGVVAAELPNAPPAAQEAQAIVARTYALFERSRHNGFDFCDLTHCQAFKGTASEPMSLGEPRILTTDGKTIASVFYTSTCGGHTTDASRAWLGASPWVVGVRDLESPGLPWCRASPHRRWVFRASRLEVREALDAESPLSLRVAHDEFGYVTNVEINNPSISIRGEDFRIMMGRHFGWSRFKSAAFQVRSHEEEIEFTGRGLGHGVGLCQHGAIGMAKAGQTAEEIVHHYFPQLILTAADHGSAP